MGNNELPEGYEWGTTTYASIFMIIIDTLVLIFFEKKRRELLRLMKQGYYFFERHVPLKMNNRLVPVPPFNVDKSDPQNPRVFDPSLIEDDGLCAEAIVV